MNFLYRLFKQDPQKRESVIAMTSGLGIFVNIVVASSKIIVGLIASSMAIISEGVNNISDAMTSVLTLVGTKLASKHPDAKHPFGYGRIEYLTSLIISVLILITGFEVLKSSVETIFNPKELAISYFSMAVVAVTAVIKFFLGIYTIRMGKKASSSALEAVGLDCRNDCFLSIVTIVSALIFIFFGLSVDAYAGIFTSLVIIKAGLEVLSETVSDLIGKSGEKELATNIYREIVKTEGIMLAADMVLHNYGPDAYQGSVNVEIDHDRTVGEVYQILHKLQLEIMHKYNVVMVFGIYAVDNDHEGVKEIRSNISKFIVAKDHVISFHALYLDPDNDDLYVDLIVDYDLEDWDGLKRDFLSYMKDLYPSKNVILTVETQFV